MARTILFFPLLLAVSTAFAEPVLYVCERPAWEDHEGCGPNNTHSTHTFRVETRDFYDDQPEYVYQGGKGCDIGSKTKYRYRYAVGPETLVFKFAQLPRAPRDKLWTTITLDLNTMTAVMSGVEQGSELFCRTEEVD